MLRDPDGFQSAIELDDAAAEATQRLQEGEDKTLASDLTWQGEIAEEDRARKRLAAQRDREIAAQLRNAERMWTEHIQQRLRQEEEAKKERVAQERGQRHRDEENRQRDIARQEAERAKAKQREEMKRRAKEEKLSVRTINATTKQCPGCQWPIEKNDGCSHMTCKSRFDSFLCPGVPNATQLNPNQGCRVTD